MLIGDCVSDGDEGRSVRGAIASLGHMSGDSFGVAVYGDEWVGLDANRTDRAGELRCSIRGATARRGLSANERRLFPSGTVSSRGRRRARGAWLRSLHRSDGRVGGHVMDGGLSPPAASAIDCIGDSARSGVRIVTIS